MTEISEPLGLLSKACVLGVLSEQPNYTKDICGHGFSPEGAEEAARKNVDSYNNENPYDKFIPLGSNMRTSEGLLHSVWKWMTE